MSAYTEHDVVAGGVQTHYAEMGSGEPVLLLHASGPGINGPLEYAKNYASIAEKFRVIMPDLLGFGKTELPDHKITNISDAYTEHMIAFMDVLGLKGAHMVGNSRGALVAIAVAAARPELVGRIVLVGNAGGGVTGEHLKAMTEMFESIRPTPEWVDWGLKSGRFNPEDQAGTPELRAELLENAKAQYGRYDAAGGIPNDVPDLRAELAATKHKVMYIRGKEDRGWPPVHQGIDVFLSTPGAIYYSMSSAGHCPQHDKPNQFNLLVKAFLSGELDN